MTRWFLLECGHYGHLDQDELPELALSLNCRKCSEDRGDGHDQPRRMVKRVPADALD